MPVGGTREETVRDGGILLGDGKKCENFNHYWKHRGTRVLRKSPLTVGIRFRNWKEQFLVHRLIYNLSMFTVFFYKKKGLPCELLDANRSKRVAISGILLRRSSKSGFFDSIFAGGVEWIRFDKIKRKRQWSDPGEAPKSTPKLGIHRNKVMLCVWWKSKDLVYFELLNSGSTVTANFYQE